MIDKHLKVPLFLIAAAALLTSCGIFDIGNPDDPPNATKESLATNAPLSKEYENTCTDNRPPTAAISVSPAPNTDTFTFRFDATPSSDPEGDKLTYVWSFGDNTTATGAVVLHRYNQTGIYTVTLTADDGCSLSKATLRLNVH